MKKLLILGAHGMAGHIINQYLTSLNKYKIYTLTRNSKFGVADYYCDVEQHIDYLDWLINEEKNFNIVINCIGLLNKPANENPTKAIYLNSYLPHYLEKITKNTQTKIIHLSTDCFVPQTKILTDKGYKNIENIKIDEKIYTHTGKLQNVCKILSRRENEKIYNIKCLSTDLIKCTENHPFLVIKRKAREQPNFQNIQWTLAKELNKNDLVAIPKIKNEKCYDYFVELKETNNYNKFLDFTNKAKNKKLNEIAKEMNIPYARAFLWKHKIKIPKKPYFFKCKLNKELAWLFGIFCAEGWAITNKRINQIYFCFGDEKKLINKTVVIIKKYFRVIPHIKKLKKQKGTQVIIYNKTISEFFCNNFYFAKLYYSYTKKIPDFIKNSSINNQREFIKGLLDGDGCYYDSIKNNFMSVGSTSETMTDELKLLILKLNILSCKSIRKPKNSIMNRIVNAKPLFVLQWSGKELYKFLNFLKKSTKNFHKTNKYNKFFENKLYWFVPIKTIIIKKYRGFVYNLEIENDHSYLLSGGISVHNCIFDGSKGNHSETDNPTETNWYGRSKALGEIKNNKDLTLRLSIIGTELKKDGIGLLNWFLNQTGEINGFVNCYWNGITTLEFAKQIDRIIDENPYLSRLYHLTPDFKINKYDLLCLIKEIWKKEKVNIIPKYDFYQDKTLINYRKEEYTPHIPNYKTQLNELYLFTNV